MITERRPAPSSTLASTGRVPAVPRVAAFVAVLLIKVVVLTAALVLVWLALR